MTGAVPVAPGQSSPETAIALLKDAAVALLAHSRDSRALGVSQRISRYLGNFPEHFVTEFLERRPARDGKPATVQLRRVPLSDWPEWADEALRQDRTQPEPDQDTLVPGEGPEAIAALERIATLLGVPCTLEAMEERIAEMNDPRNPVLPE